MLAFETHTRPRQTEGSFKLTVVAAPATVVVPPDLRAVDTSVPHVIEERFAELAKQWRDRTAAQSVLSARFRDPAYLAILGLGRPIIPLLLRELAARTDHWWHALMILTGENPAPPSAAGRLDELADAWLQWAHHRGIAV